MRRQINRVKRMKQLSKFSILLLFVALVFCACDKNDSDDNGGCIYPNPAYTLISNYSVTVETVVDAPQAEVKNAIEQDLAANPPFGGCTAYQIVTTKTSVGLAAIMELHVVKPESEEWYGDYVIDNSAEKFEDNENYHLFSASTDIMGLAKWDIIDYASSEKSKLVGTYDVYVQKAAPGSKKGDNLFFCEDLTKKYREKYPQADIHAVVRRQVLTFVKGGDVIKD